jgi:glycosyltransferase involved in cell wall biosynthesis
VTLNIERRDDYITAKQIDISVIVLVFGVEKYLRRCLDSLLAQNFENVEFLLIDDGSTDKSRQICEEYAAKDSRFIVFHKENGGVSSVRNYGIEKARGDYLMFVDGDDWVNPDYCARPFSLAKEKDVDLVMFAHQEVYESTELITKKTSLEEGYKTWQEGIDLMLLGGFGVYAWNKLYKRTLFDDIRYPDGRSFQDQETTWKLIYKAKRIYCSNTVLYYYFMRDDSVTHQMSAKKVTDRFEMKLQLFDGLEAKGYLKPEFDKVRLDAALHYVMRIKARPNDSNYPRAREIIQNCSASYKKFDRKHRFLIRLFLKHRKLFDLVCTISGKRVK